MATRKQIDANRRNAHQATGPRTPEGKDRVRFNALKHGLLAHSIILAGKEHHESRTEFDSLLDQLLEEFRPVGVLEQIQVEKIAVCYWRQARALRAESFAIDARARSLGLIKDPAASNSPAPGPSAIETDPTRNLVRRLDQARVRRYLAQVAANYEPELTQLAEESRQAAAAVHPAPIDPPSPADRLNPPANSDPVSSADPVYPLPQRDDLLSLVRYENMIDRQLNRALLRLADLQRIRLARRPSRSADAPAASPHHHANLESCNGADEYPTQRVGSVEENVTGSDRQSDRTEEGDEHIIENDQTNPIPGKPMVLMHRSGTSRRSGSDGGRSGSEDRDDPRNPTWKTADEPRRGGACLRPDRQEPPAGPTTVGGSGRSTHPAPGEHP